MAEDENNEPETPETEPEKDNTVVEETPATAVVPEETQEGEGQARKTVSFEEAYFNQLLSRPTP